MLKSTNIAACVSGFVPVWRTLESAAGVHERAVEEVEPAKASPVAILKFTSHWRHRRSNWRVPDWWFGCVSTIFPVLF